MYNEKVNDEQLEVMVCDAPIGSSEYCEELLNKVINHKSYGRLFVPESDGKKLLLQLLPVKQAIAAGENSRLYFNVARTYKLVMKSLMENQLDPDISREDVECLAKSNKKLSLDEIESMERPDVMTYQFMRYGEY